MHNGCVYVRVRVISAACPVAYAVYQPLAIPSALIRPCIFSAGGTGNTLLQLRKLCDKDNTFCGTCVEPSDAMRQVNDGVDVDGIKFVDNDVLSWVNSNDGLTYTHVLLKEMVHHIPTEELHEIFAKLKVKLDKDGMALIVTRNQLYQDFPLPAEARYACDV